MYWNFRKYWLVTDKIPNILKSKYTGRRGASWRVIHVQFGPLMSDTLFTQSYWCYCVHIQNLYKTHTALTFAAILTTHPPQDNVTDGVPGWCDWDPQNVTSAPLLLLVNPYIPLYGICAQLPGLQKRQGKRREDRDFQVSWHIKFVHCCHSIGSFQRGMDKWFDLLRARDYFHNTDQLWGLSSLLFNDFPRNKAAWRVKLTIHLPRCRDILSRYLGLCAFMKTVRGHRCF